MSTLIFSFVETDFLYCYNLLRMSREVMRMNRIRELRKQMKLTQKELARHLQIADSTLSYWEMEKYEPDNESLKKLSRFFKVPIDFILGGSFAEWEMYRDNALRPDVDTPLHTDADMSVGESKAIYQAGGIQKITPDQSATDDLRSTLTTFQRSEFEGLTQEETDKLAEYAEFIKAKRMKKDR